MVLSKTISKRNILFIRNNQNKIIAVSCLKKDDLEKKICTFFVSENYRNLGIGSYLIEKSLNILETNKPLITFTEDKLPMFKSFISKYNWQLTKTKNISNNYKELYFN